MSKLDAIIKRQINFLITKKVKRAAGYREPFLTAALTSERGGAPEISSWADFPSENSGSPGDVLTEAVALAGCFLPLRAETVCSTWRTLNKPFYQILKMLSWLPSTSPASPPLCHLQTSEPLSGLLSSFCTNGYHGCRDLRFCRVSPCELVLFLNVPL